MAYITLKNWKGKKLNIIWIFTNWCLLAKVCVNKYGACHPFNELLGNIKHADTNACFQHYQRIFLYIIFYVIYI